MTSDRPSSRVKSARGGEGNGTGTGAVKDGDSAGRDDRRSNPALAAVVDQAIRFDAERGAALAWAYLTQHGLPPETILRVLAAPAAGQLPRRAPRAATEGATFRV
jgi:hypothetical protein